MLTTKQKVYLRSLAQTEKPVFQIGHDGISDNLIKTVSDYLKKHELVKISVLKNNDGDLKETAFDLAMMTKSECIQVIGRQIVLYRRSKEPKIILP
ncbi:MAG: ribosome assembly RNA-binding protein YhbY [Erysipelotrichaceae bacterium]|nr:ribosome assembly RNA-binding protein YhbY [Erysipelotrichaceae bacterium]